MAEPTFINSFSQTVEILPPETALLVIDMQNATGNRHLGLGKLLQEAGSAESANYRFDRIENLLLPNIDKLLASFRKNCAGVIYITYGAETSDARDVVSTIRAIVKKTNNIVGNEEHEIVAQLQPMDDELVLNKTTQGAFRSTRLDSVLRAMHINTVVCVGVSTNNCVAMTAMEASDLQYNVVIVSDATGTDSEEMQNSSLVMLGRLWSKILTTEEVIQAVDSYSPGTPQLKP